MAKEEEKKTLLGIDLGTTNSAAASLDDAGQPRPVKNAEGDYVTPSTICFMDKNNYIVGKEAKNLSMMYPHSIVREIKREMGKADAEGKSITYFVDPDGKHWNPEELSSLILKKIKEDAESITGQPIGPVVITVPAYFRDSERRATINAGLTAGLDVLDVIDEPTAAALCYGLTKKGEGIRRFLVYDLGGGTFDVSIIEVDADGNVRVVATDGVRILGGTDFDMRIADRIGKEAEKQGVSLDPTEDPSACQEARDKAERFKHSLSTLQEATFNQSIQDKQISFTDTREEFEAGTRDLLERTGEKVKDVLKAADMSPSDIDDTILVGGSTRMPMVEDFLISLMGKPPKKDADPDLVVAQGAALAAGQMVKERGQKVISMGGKEVKALPGGKFTNATAHALGCAAYDPDMTFREFTPIIAKNTALPAKCTEKFSLVDKDQTTVLVGVFVGQKGQPLDECLYIGDVELSGLPAGNVAEERITVTYEYSKSGIVSVTVSDSISGKSTNGEIKHQLGMNKADIKKAKKKIEKMSV